MPNKDSNTRSRVRDKKKNDSSSIYSSKSIRVREAFLFNSTLRPSRDGADEEKSGGPGNKRKGGRR
jgi:hypothetical protein